MIMNLNICSIIRIALIASILMAFSAPSVLAAVSASDDVENPVERIVEESEGNITIDMPANILERLLKEEERKTGNGAPTLRPGINKTTGYRIQIFSDGRNQSTLENRARARGNAVVAKFPKYRGQVYSFSSSPNWYTRVGNFKSESEAQSALTELKRAFPQFAGEMRVVRSQIVIIK